MAAKTTAPKTVKTKAVAAKATVTKAVPKGLVLSTAQWKAYNAAYNAAAGAARNKIALQAAASSFRKYRLGTAHAMMKTAAASRRASRVAAIAAYATRRSWVQSRLGHQNAALQARIENDMYRHAAIAGRLQYAAAGEQAWAHAAVMGTVDQAQALAYETARFKLVNKTAKKAANSTVNTGKKTTLSKAQSTAIAKAGSTAGLKAAAKVRTAPRSAIAALPRRRSQWLGDETEPRCIVFAVANHLLKTHLVKADDRDIDDLAEMAGPEPTIEETLWRAYMSGWPSRQERGERIRLADYHRVAASPSHLNVLSLVIGYEVMTDDGLRDHAALSLPGGRIVSWGSETERESPVEEAWELLWEN